jgi:hypothetical protein
MWGKSGVRFGGIGSAAPSFCFTHRFSARTVATLAQDDIDDGRIVPGRFEALAAYPLKSRRTKTGSPGGIMTERASRVVWFEELGRGDVARVGGKNASLGEMVAISASKA